MPFNNGLRPEGIIAVGSLITYVLIERAVISGRMTPAALAVMTAAFTLGIQPTGLIAVVGLGFLLMITLQLSISLSGHQEAIRELSEANALLEERLARVEDRERER